MGRRHVRAVPGMWVPDSAQAGARASTLADSPRRSAARGAHDIRVQPRMGDCQLWSSAPYPSPAATADPLGGSGALIGLMPGCDDPAVEFSPPPGSGPDRGSLPPSVRVTRLG